MTNIRIEGQAKRYEKYPPKGMRVTVILKKELHDFLMEESRKAGTTNADYLRGLLELRELRVRQKEMELA